jgi:excisionase family DNA binding protein
MSIKDEYLTVAETAKRLRITKQTVYRWIDSGQLTAEKIGKEMLIAKKTIIDRDEKLFFRSLGNIIMDRIGDRLQFERPIKEVEGWGVLKQNPDEPIYDYSISYTDGSVRKVTLEYEGYDVKPDKKADKMSITFVFKRKIQDIPSERNRNVAQK